MMPSRKFNDRQTGAAAQRRGGFALEIAFQHDAVPLACGRAIRPRIEVIAGAQHRQHRDSLRGRVAGETGIRRLIQKKTIYRRAGEEVQRLEVGGMPPGRNPVSHPRHQRERQQHFPIVLRN